MFFGDRRIRFSFPEGKCTGVGRDGVEFYYGQCLDDGVIVYNDYHPMVQMFGDNTYRELESKDYDKLGIT